MSGLSTYAENKLIDHALGTTTFTKPTAVYLALFTTDPQADGSGTEVSTGGYARQAVTFGASSGGAATNSSSEVFTATGADFGRVTHIGIFDAVSSGNLLFKGALATPRTVVDGESITFAVGAITVTFG
jgi:hypothetical protein